MAALEYAGAAMGLMLPSDDLRDASRDIEAELERQVSGSGEIQQMIAGLERNYDQNAEDQERSLLETEQGLPDGALAGLAADAVRGSAAPDQLKAELLEGVDAWLGAPPAGPSG